MPRKGLFPNMLQMRSPRIRKDEQVIKELTPHTT